MSHRPLLSEQAIRRAEALEALDEVFPFDRREQLAHLLTDDDAETLVSMARDRVKTNTLRAFASDLAYLEVWCEAYTSQPLPWPAPETLILAFLAHHVPAGEPDLLSHAAMPEDVAGRLRSEGLLRADQPHTKATVKRRLSNWSALTKRRGLDGNFGSPAVRDAWRQVDSLAKQRGRPETLPITAEILARLLNTCGSDSLVDLRDYALLSIAFAGGGLRRAEVAALDRGDVVRGGDPDALFLRLGSRASAGDMSAVSVRLAQTTASALRSWLDAADIAQGPLFRRIDRWGHVDWRPLTPQAVNVIVKARCRKAGLDPKLYSADGIRVGARQKALG